MAAGAQRRAGESRRRQLLADRPLADLQLQNCAGHNPIFLIAFVAPIFSAMILL
jgi:hypothetical protein